MNLTIGMMLCLAAGMLWGTSKAPEVFVGVIFFFFGNILIYSGIMKLLGA